MKFIYSGPTSGVTLQDGEQEREVMLHTDKEVDLPEEHEYTKTLVALQHLVPVPEPKTSKASPRAAASGDTGTKGD